MSPLSNLHLSVFSCSVRQPKLSGFQLHFAVLLMLNQIKHNFKISIFILTNLTDSLQLRYILANGRLPAIRIIA